MKTNNLKMLTIKDLQGKKPHFTKAGNIKLGSNMWVWSTMKGAYDETRYVKAYRGLCSGTCGSHCQCCTKDCYVNRSYRYGSVIKGHAINTTWMKEDLDGTFKALESQIKRAKKKPEVIRINQSGEIMTNKELIKWADLARKHPKIQMYLYTKNYQAVGDLDRYLDKINLDWPKNLTILLSIWHEVGIKEWELYKNLPNIKAFVYDDGAKNLKLLPQTYCKAYDDKGKMDHSITCEKCKKCFNRAAGCKVIGCKAH